MSPIALEQDAPHAETRSLCHDDPRWQLALRVTESKQFCKSLFLTQFLLFICENMLTGSSECLTEQIIGERVFRRRPGYSTGEDNIVRTYAHRLRDRLDQHFEQEGLHEPLRIRIPRGGYTPLFEDNLSAVVVRSTPSVLPPTADLSSTHSKSTEAKSNQSDLESLDEPTSNHFSRSKAAASAAVFLLLGAFIGFFASRNPERLSESPAHALWSQIFSRQSGTFIVTTDNGLGVLQDITGRYANLHDYMDGSYFAQFDKTATSEQRTMQRLSRERLTSVPDAAASASILTLPEAHGRQVSLRNARSLQLGDLKQSNLILLGSNYGDPWVSLFEPAMNFQVNYHAKHDTYESEIINRNPLPGEQRVYVNNSTSAPYTTYAIIALMPNLDHNGWALLIEGLTMAGTEASTEFLLHGNIAPLLREATRNGSLQPFEVVLKTTNLDSEASPSTILLKRVY